MKVVEGVWKPLQASRGEIRVSHLMFAEAIIFFSQAATDQVDCDCDGLTSFVLLQVKALICINRPFIFRLICPSS